MTAASLAALAWAASAAVLPSETTPMSISAWSGSTVTTDSALTVIDGTAGLGSWARAAPRRRAGNTSARRYRMGLSYRGHRDALQAR